MVKKVSGTFFRRCVVAGSAAVWIVNGLFFKLLNLAPRHELIVSEILGKTFARPFTVAIGIGEVLLAIAILTGIQRRLIVVLQIALVLGMNIIEFILAPHLLMFGRLNIVIAMAFCALLFYAELYRQHPSNPEAVP